MWNVGKQFGPGILCQTLEHEIHETSELPKSSMITRLSTMPVAFHIGSWHDCLMIRSTIKRIYIERMVTGNTRMFTNIFKNIGKRSCCSFDSWDLCFIIGTVRGCLALLAGIWRGLRGLGASVSSLIQQLLCHFIVPPGHHFKSLKTCKKTILQSKVSTKYGAFPKQTEQHTSLFHFSRCSLHGSHLRGILRNCVFGREFTDRRSGPKAQVDF